MNKYGLSRENNVSANKINPNDNSGLNYSNNMMNGDINNNSVQNIPDSYNNFKLGILNKQNLSRDNINNNNINKYNSTNKRE